MIAQAVQDEVDKELTYTPKMKISPRALENRQILLNAFANSTEYMRYIQISRLLIQAAKEGSQIPTHFFHGEDKPNLGSAQGQTIIETNESMNQVANQLSIRNPAQETN